MKSYIFSGFICCLTVTFTWHPVCLNIIDLPTLNKPNGRHVLKKLTNETNAAVTDYRLNLHISPYCCIHWLTWNHHSSCIFLHTWYFVWSVQNQTEPQCGVCEHPHWPGGEHSRHHWPCRGAEHVFRRTFWVRDVPIWQLTWCELIIFICTVVDSLVSIIFLFILLILKQQ